MEFHLPSSSDSFFVPMAQHPKSGLGFYITHNYTHPVGLLWTSDQLVAEAATNKTHNIYKIQTSKSSAGFEPATQAIELLQNTATGMGQRFVNYGSKAVAERRYRSTVRFVAL
jgi:hypothetical protein